MDGMRSSTKLGYHLFKQAEKIEAGKTKLSDVLLTPAYTNSTDSRRNSITVERAKANKQRLVVIAELAKFSESYMDGLNRLPVRDFSGMPFLGLDDARWKSALSRFPIAVNGWMKGMKVFVIAVTSDFNQVARRITNLREVAAMRERQMEQIVTLSEQVSVERTRLTGQQRALDSVKRSLTTQRTRLQKDSQAARANIKQLSKKEKAALQQKIAREQRLDVAIDELRKLTRGNKEGNTFTAKTSNLRLPVVGGGVKRYKGNMAEIAGPKGAQVISIYEGKVVEVKRNRITNKYDVYIAHGEYISSYANLNSVTVGKDDKVARNQQIGTIGSGVDVMTMQPEYKMVFGIYGPSPKVQMRASDCFKK